MIRNVTAAVARGSTIHATLDFIRHTHGRDTVSAIVGLLDEDDRRAILSADLTTEVPYESVLALWRIADALLATSHPTWMEEAGAFALESIGQQLYGRILRRASPHEFITQSAWMFRLYYAPGEWTVPELSPGRAILRLLGFDTVTTLFCRRQTGGLRRAVELAGGRRVTSTHVRCVHEGDATCEWELCWT